MKSFVKVDYENFAKKISDRIKVYELTFGKILPHYKCFFIDYSGDLDEYNIYGALHKASAVPGPKIIVFVEEDYLLYHRDLEDSLRPFQQFAECDTWTKECFVVTNNKLVYELVNQKKICNIIYLPALYDLLAYKNTDSSFENVFNYPAKKYTSFAYSNDRYKFRKKVLDFCLSLDETKFGALAFNSKNLLDNGSQNFLQFNDAPHSDYHIDRDVYKHDVFGMALESIGVSYASAILSEKVYKFYAHAKPVIVLSKGQNARQAIIDFGFDPCDWLIDWSFDQCIDFNTKHKLFLKEIERLCSIPIDDLNHCCIKNIHSIKHNFYHRLELLDNYSTQVKNFANKLV